MGRRRHRLTGLIAGAACMAGLPAHACSPPADAASSVRIRAVAGTDIILDDGRRVRLAGIDTASARLPDLAGREASLYGTERPDRHGVLRSGLVIDGEDLAQRLVREGNAITRPGRDDSQVVCFGDMLSAEDEARRARLGLWSDPRYVVRNASDPRDAAVRGEGFALLEGTIVHVGTTANAVWLDFGADWRTDVTVVIRRRDWPLFEKAGLTTGALDHRRVRVRGPVIMHNGPRIDIADPAAIELVNTVPDGRTRIGTRLESVGE